MSDSKSHARKRRHQRIRKKIFGTKERPRFCVTKSLKHLTVQLIDDITGQTLLGLSTCSKELRDKVKRGNKEGAKVLGHLIADKAKVLKIEQVVFDRGGCIYHGRIRELAEVVRKSGLKF